MNNKPNPNSFVLAFSLDPDQFEPCSRAVQRPHELREVPEEGAANLQSLPIPRHIDIPTQMALAFAQ